MPSPSPSPAMAEDKTAADDAAVTAAVAVLASRDAASDKTEDLVAIDADAFTAATAAVAVLASRDATNNDIVEEKEPPPPSSSPMEVEVEVQVQVEESIPNLPPLPDPGGPPEEQAVLNADAAALAPIEKQGHDDAAAPFPPVKEETQQTILNPKPNPKPPKFAALTAAAAYYSPASLSLKRVVKTSFNFKSDIDSKEDRISHPTGILHATKNTSSREEHAFAWITNVSDAAATRQVVEYLQKHGYRSTLMRFIPFSSKANWIARFPYAVPHIQRDDATGKMTGRIPRWDKDGTASSGPGGSKSDKGKKNKRGSSAKSRKSPPKLLRNGDLPNAEREVLHKQIYEYFTWLHDELSTMETNQAGRRQVSNAGVSVPALRSLVSKMEGAFKGLSAEREREERESAVAIANGANVNGNGNGNGMNVVNGGNGMIVEGNGMVMDADGMIMNNNAGGPIPTAPKGLPYLESALKEEMTAKVLENTPDSSSTTTKRQSKSPSQRAKDAAWRLNDFDTMFQKLVDFNVQMGHPNVPVKHPELGRWVSELRLNKKLLREKGLEWEAEEMPPLPGAVGGEENGNGNNADTAVTQQQQQMEVENATTDAKGGGRQRTTEETIAAALATPKSNTRLTREQVMCLDSIQFAWTVMPVRVTWEDRFEELRQFKIREGRFPSNKEGTIGNWLKNQRKLYTKRDGDFMTKRYAKFEEIGVPLRQRNYTALGWEDRFQQLVEFGRVNRHFNVPNPTPDNGDGREQLEDESSEAADAKRFYKFVARIHTEYRSLQRGNPSTLLTPERVAQLQSIGFDFSTKPDRIVPDLDWSTRIQQLEAFQSEMGHMRVDPNYDKYSNLGGWAVEVSERHRRWQEGQEYLSPDMVERFNHLNALGFGFDVFRSRRGERTWVDSFNLLLHYRQETGSCRVPHHYKADFRLGSWVAVQRKEYKLLVEGKPSRITQERIHRLESVGFEWVARRGHDD